MGKHFRQFTETILRHMIDYLQLDVGSESVNGNLFEVKNIVKK